MFKQRMQTVANVWIRMMSFSEVGDRNEGHKHTHDHSTLLAHGAVRLTVNGVTSEFSAPTIIYIKAGLDHQMEALAPDTVVYCVHALRDGKEIYDIVSPETVPNGVRLESLVQT